MRRYFLILGTIDNLSFHCKKITVILWPFVGNLTAWNLTLKKGPPVCLKDQTVYLDSQILVYVYKISIEITYTKVSPKQYDVLGANSIIPRSINRIINVFYYKVFYSRVDYSAEI